MKRKRGKRRAFCVEADVAKAGLHIKRFTTASAPRQAIFQIARELEKENPTIRIFLENVVVTPPGPVS